MNHLLLFLLFLLASFSSVCSQSNFVANANFLGCFDAPASGFQYSAGSSFTVAECHSHARSRFHSVFALTRNNRCFTDASRRSYNPVNVQLCDAQCRSDSFGRTCGNNAGTTFSVWAVNYGPEIYSLSPLNLPTSGGQTLTINGRWFQGTSNTGPVPMSSVSVKLSQPDDVDPSNTLPPLNCPVTSLSDSQIVCNMPASFGYPIISVSVNNQPMRQLARWSQDVFWWSTANQDSFGINCVNITNTNVKGFRSTALCTSSSTVALRWMWTMDPAAVTTGFKCTPWNIPANVQDGWDNARLCIPNELPYDLTFSYKGPIATSGSQGCLQLMHNQNPLFASGNCYLCSSARQPTILNGNSVLRYPFASPFISSISPSNGATIGGTTITVNGGNFGAVSAASFSSFTINGRSCAIVVGSWSHTAFRCVTPAGEGGAPDLVLTIGGVQTSYTQSSLWSYSAPVITAISPSSFNTTGGVPLTLTGSNFGTTPSIVRLMLQLPFLPLVCPVVTWTDSQIVCNLPAGSGQSIGISVTTLGRLGQGSSVILSATSLQSNAAVAPFFSYLSPFISRISPSSMPTTGSSAGGLLTIFGKNFGFQHSSYAVRIDGSLCQIRSWTDSASSDSQIVCQMTATCASQAAIELAIAGQSNQPFSVPIFAPSMNNASSTIFAPPRLCDTGSGVCPSGFLGASGVAAASSIDINGNNFCDANSALLSAPGSPLSVKIGSADCAIINSVWQESRISCTPPTSIWGYNVVTFVTRFGLSNQAQAVANRLYFQYTPKIQSVVSSLGSAPNAQPGDPARFPTSGNYDVTLRVRSTPDSRFSAQYGSLISVSVNGISAAVKSYTPPSAVSSLGATTDVGTIVFSMPASQGANSDITVQVGLLADSQPFSFDFPFISSISPAIPSAGQTVQLTINGANFGSQSALASVAVSGLSGCAILSLNSTRIVCSISGGSGSGQTVQVTLSDGRSSNSFVFNFASPTLISMSPTTGDVAGGFPVTLVGSQFQNTQANVMFGAISVAVTILNATHATFSAPPAAGNQQVSIVINGQSSNSLAFIYANPQVTSISPSNADSDARDSQGQHVLLSVIGTGFVPSSSRVTIGGVVCPLLPASSTRTMLVCSLPPGGGSSLPIAVTVGSAPSNQNVLFSYNPPRPTSISPTNGVSEGLIVTITGRSFSTAGTITVGSFGCIPTSQGAYTHNQIICSLAEGEGANLQVRIRSREGLHSQQSVLFSYNPPFISQLVPAASPTAGGSVVTLIGTSFGLNASVQVNGAGCPRTATPQTHRTFECVVPAGEGTGRSVQLSVAGLNSNVGAFNYLAPVISSISPANGPADGSGQLMISGSNFGLSGTVTIGGLAAPFTQRSHTQFVVNVPVNTGVSRAVAVTAAGQTGTSPVPFSYDAPILNSLSSPGCQQSGSAIVNCPVTGGASITATGRNFGPNSSPLPARVQLGSSVISSDLPLNCTVTSRSDTQIVFTLPAYAIGGFNFPIRILVDGQSVSQNLLSFAGPIVTPNTLASAVSMSTTIVSSRGSSRHLLLSSTAGFPTAERTLTISGQYFGSDSSVVEVRFDRNCQSRSLCQLSAQQRFQSMAFNCSVVSVLDSSITCRLPEATGANMTVIVRVNLQYSMESADQFSYPAPQVLPNSIGLNDGVNPVTKSSAVVGLSGQGDSIRFDVDFVGSRVSELQVTMANSAGPAAICAIETVNFAASPKWIQCKTPQGFGANYRFTVIANGQSSMPGSDRYQYVAAPVITAIIGAQVNGNETSGNPTQGGLRVTIKGDLFGQTGLTVFMGDSNCAMPQFIDINTITCVPPAGSGLKLPVVVGVGNKFSAPFNGFSYSTPIVLGVGGCENVTLDRQMDSFGQPYVLLTRNCSRFGNSILTLQGDSFGPASPVPSVVVGGKLCTNLQVDQSQRRATCQLPAGNTLNQPVIFIQSTGPSTVASGLVSYRQCAPGTWAPADQLVCQGTPAGTYTDTDGLNAPKVCSNGFWSAANATTCTACIPGTFSVAGANGATGCQPCSVGTFNNNFGQSTCMDCPAGRFAASGSQSTCQACAAGSFAPASRATACQPCAAGSFASGLGSLQCDACAAGFWSGPGNFTCRACQPGSYSAPGSSSCLFCPIGRSAPSQAMANCTDCAPGFFANVTGQSSCIACLPGTSTVGRPASIACSPCSRGNYSSSPGSAWCAQCEQGKFDGSRGGASGCSFCPVGTSNSLVEQTTCRNCTVGRFADFAGSIQCSTCPPGFFSRISSATQCSQCLPGTFNRFSGVSACAICPAGQFSLLGQSSCTDCEYGFFQPRNRSSSCLPCAVGRAGDRDTKPRAERTVSVPDPNNPGAFLELTEVLGLTTCTDCNPGNYTNNPGSPRCLQCEQGTFQPQPAMSSCIACSNGTFASGLGNTGCTRCQAGRYCEVARAGSGEDCDGGTYQPFIGYSFCFGCDIGKFSRGTVGSQPSTQCDPCMPGEYASNARQSSCNRCEPGKFSLGGATTCIACAIGKYQGNFGQSSCVDAGAGSYVANPGSPRAFDCQPGSYTNRSMQSACTLCEPGRASPVSGATSCVSCPAGAIAVGLGTLQCQACEPGKFALQGASVCRNCSVGTYADQPGFSTCKLCAPGTNTTLVGQKTCTPCARGRFQPNSGSALCDGCPIGTFSQPGAQSCTACQIGKYGPATAQPGCVACPIGHYSNSSGLTECSPCQIGRYQLEQGKSSCEDCPTGRFAALMRSATCVPCSPGTYTNLTGQIACQPCQRGKSQDEEGATSCSFCDVGRFSAGENAISCSPCDAGLFMNTTGATVCFACEPGSYQPALGRTACQICQIGKYMTFGASAALDCLSCDAGRYSDRNATVVCPVCPPGSFSKYPGSTSCQLCDVGHFSPGGQTICTQCGAQDAGSEIKTAAVAPYRGMSSCSACSPPAIADEQYTNCQCPSGMAAKPGNYSDPKNTLFMTCLSCPVGAECDAPGIEWSTMRAQPGFWRTAYISPSSDFYLSCVASGYCGTPDSLNENPLFYRCADVTICNGGLNEAWMINEPSELNTCAGNRVGPTCSLCADGYTEQLGRICVKCQSQGSDWALVVFICLCLSFALMLMYYVLLKANAIFYLASAEAERLKETQSSDDYAFNRARSITGGLAGAATRNPLFNQEAGVNEVNSDFQAGLLSSVALDSLLDDEADTQNSFSAALHRYDHNLSLTGPPSAKPNFTFKLKIILSFAQIVSNSAINLNIPWPHYFSLFMSWLNPVNLDFVKVSNIGCVVDSSFYNKFLLVVCLPPVVLCCLLLFFFLPRYVVAGRDRIERKIVRQKTWLLFLYTLFLIYPFVSSTILATFVCRKIGQHIYLIADQREHCHTAQWDRFVSVASILIPVYPVGIPALFFFMLYRYRNRLEEAGVRAEIGFLYDAYVSTRWWFEMVDAMHKLFMTSLLLLIPEEAQMPTGIAITGLYFVLLSVLKPYLRKSDDRLHLFGQCELILLFIAANNFYAAQTFDRFYDLLLSVVLILIVVCYFSFFALQGLASWKRWKRELAKADSAVKKLLEDAADGKGARSQSKVELNVMPEAILMERASTFGRTDSFDAAAAGGTLRGSTINGSMRGLTSAEKLLLHKGADLEGVDVAFEQGTLGNMNSMQLKRAGSVANDQRRMPDFGPIEE